MGKTFSQITIAYPTTANSITRSLDSTTLTVQIAFGASCSSVTTQINFPFSVKYIPGSLLKTGGSGSTITIAESNISNLAAPIFSLNGVTAAGDITFTVKRLATCGTGVSGKDTIIVNGTCGTVIEDASNINTYNIFSPAVNITAPLAVSNTYLNSTHSRIGTITNGGNGCIDTLRFYIVYPNAGLELISNQLVVNGVTIMPNQISGDTLHFKIFGASIFGATKLLCNGQSVSFTENIRIKKCNLSNTEYNAGWGKKTNELCQTATTFSTVTLTSGAAIPASNINILQSLSYCRDGIYTITYTNNGSGANAGAMYNAIAYLGHNAGYNNTFLPRKELKIDIRNVTINGIGVTCNLATSPYNASEQVYLLNFSQLNTDVDGASIGLADLDGDGQFDDLAPGKTVTIRFEEKWNCDNKCPIDRYYVSQRTAMRYNDMCGNLSTTSNLIQSAPYYHYANQDGSVILPVQISEGVPFTTQVCFNGQWNPPSYRPTDSMYLEINIPAGFALAGSGNIKINGVALVPADYTFGGGKLIIKKKGYLEALCYSYDLVYTCGAVPSATFDYLLRYVGDNSCSCEEKLACLSKVVYIQCNTSCTTGFANNNPTITRLSLGYTDNTLTTKVSAASITAIPLKSALPKDTINIRVNGKQYGNYNNLNYYYQVGKAPNGDDVIAFVNGTLNHKSFLTNVVTSCAVPLPTMASTSSLTVFNFNLTSCLPGTIISNNDSVWIDFKYRITTANNGLLYDNKLTPVPNSLSYLFNKDALNNEIYCKNWVTDYLVCGIEIIEQSYSDKEISGCALTSLDGELKPYYEDGIDLFPGEYRPMFEIDSIVITLPAGYEYDNTGTCYFNSGYWGSLTVMDYYSTVTIVPQINGNKATLINPKNGSWKTTDLSKTTFYTHNRYKFPIKVTCASAVGTSRGGTEYYAKSYFYEDKVGDSYQKLTPVNGTTRVTLNEINKPAITLQNNTGIVAGVSQQQYWDVQINNPSTQTAPSVWMALENVTTDILIDSVVLKPSNTIVTPITYLGTNKWYQLTSAGINGGNSQQVRVYFKYLKCTADSIRMIAGWNCTGYPSPNPTAYSCQSLNQWLTVIPQISQVQLSIEKQPNFPSNSLCSNDTVAVIVNSAQAGDIDNPFLKIIPPAGLTIKTPVAVEFPLGSGNWQNVTPTLASGEYILNLESHSAVGLNGIKGTIKNPLAADRQVRINVEYETSCGFTNGTKLNFVVQGNRPCGNAALGNNDEVRSNPIIVTGTGVTGSASSSLSIIADTMKCGNSATINMSVTPIISSTSDKDTAQLNLPEGMHYVSGSLTGCATCSVNITPRPGGGEIVKIKLPNAVAANTLINFSINVNIDVDATCNRYYLDLQTIRTGNTLSCGASICSSPTPVVLSSAYDDVMVQKAELQITEFKLTGSSIGYYPGGTYTGNVTVVNFGTQNVPSGYVAEVFCFGNPTPIGYINLPAINVGQTITSTNSITIPVGCSGGTNLQVIIRKTVTTPSASTQCICAEPAAITATVLPVKLLNFDATYKNNKVELIWNTQNETGGVSYFIERSFDGIRFEIINQINADGTSFGNYTLEDNRLPISTNKLYYRLKITEPSGIITYSKVIIINKQNNYTELVVTPKLAQQFIKVSFNAPANQSVEIVLLNTEGKIIKQWTKAVLTGYNSLQLDNVNALASGVYIVKIRGKSIDLQQKFYLLL